MELGIILYCIIGTEVLYLNVILVTSINTHYYYNIIQLVTYYVLIILTNEQITISDVTREKSMVLYNALLSSSDLDQVHKDQKSG